MTRKLSELDERIQRNKEIIKKLREERKAEMARSKSRQSADARKYAARVKIVVGSLLINHNPEIALQLLRNHASDRDKELIGFVQMQVERLNKQSDNEDQSLIEASKLLKGAIG